LDQNKKRSGQRITLRSVSLITLQSSMVICGGKSVETIMDLSSSGSPSNAVNLDRS